MRVIKGPVFLLWACENVEKQISCLALNLGMIKNKVNPTAAEGTSSCEGERGKAGKGSEEGGREGRGGEGLEEKPHSDEKTCLLISWVERDEDLQTGWHTGRWATFSALS